MNNFSKIFFLRYKWLFLVFTICSQNLNAQYRITRHFTQRVDTIDLSDENYILRKKEGFTAFLPERGKASSSIMFFMGEQVEANSKFSEMALIEPAIKKNIAVIFITSGNYFDFYFDDRDLEKVDSSVIDCMKRTKLPKNKVMFAGIGLGGTRAMKYAIHCMQGKAKSGIKPAALTICDSPLDMLRYWKANTQSVESPFDSTSKDEGMKITQYLLVGLSGTPEGRRDKYVNYSPFCHEEKDGGNAKELIGVPVRAYYDGDIHWWIENTRKDFYGMNCIDLAAFINLMKKSGNTQAELIGPVLTSKKKADNPGKPDPWSAVNYDELIEWYQQTIEKPKKKK